jgi:hypothetical protein
MDRVRRHLTFANVVSLAALFVALGGTAVAAVIVTSNSQVAKDTISGHKPPSGKHANIISGSINGQDVANKGLTPTDVESLVAHISGSAVTLPAQPSNNTKPIPLAHNVWTQQPGEADLVFGTSTGTAATENCLKEAQIYAYDADTGKPLNRGHSIAGGIGGGRFFGNFDSPGQIPPANSSRRIELRATAVKDCGRQQRTGAFELYVFALR